MKKFFVLMLVIVMSLTIMSCGNTNNLSNNLDDYEYFYVFTENGTDRFECELVDTMVIRDGTLEVTQTDKRLSIYNGTYQISFYNYLGDD